MFNVLLIFSAVSGFDVKRPHRADENGSKIRTQN